MVLTAASAEWMKTIPWEKSVLLGSPGHHLVSQVLACIFTSQDSDMSALSACAHRKCCCESQWIKIQEKLCRMN